MVIVVAAAVVVITVIVGALFPVHASTLFVCPKTKNNDATVTSWLDVHEVRQDYPAVRLNW